MRFEPRLVALGVVGLALACGWGESDEAAFTREMAARFDAAGLPATVTGELTLSVEKDGEPIDVNVHRVWMVCQNDPGRCDSDAAFFVEGVAAPPIERAVANVRPVLRDQATVDEYARLVAEALDAGPGGQLVHRPLVDGLQIGYAFDSTHTITPLSADDQAALGLDADGLHAAAVANLGALPFTPERLDPSAAVWMLVHGDSYDAARLALTEPWETFDQAHPGTLVAVAPCRDAVFFADTTDATHVEAMLRLAEQAYLTEPYPIRPVPLEWTPTGWIAWDGDL